MANDSLVEVWQGVKTSCPDLQISFNSSACGCVTFSLAGISELFVIPSEVVETFADTKRIIDTRVSSAVAAAGQAVRAWLVREAERYCVEAGWERFRVLSAVGVFEVLVELDNGAGEYLVRFPLDAPDWQNWSKVLSAIKGVISECGNLPATVRRAAVRLGELLGGEVTVSARKDTSLKVTYGDGQICTARCSYLNGWSGMTEERLLSVWRDSVNRGLSIESKFVRSEAERLAQYLTLVSDLSERVKSPTHDC